MTKYRQTFTVETDVNPANKVPWNRALEAIFETILDEHWANTQSDKPELAGDTATVSWTAPEPIIEVPTGIGAVVVDARGNAWIKQEEESDSKHSWHLSGKTSWCGDSAMLDLLKAGAEIKSHGVEL